MEAGRGSDLGEKGFDGRPIDEVEKLVDISAAVAEKVGVVGVFVDIKPKEGNYAPDGVTILGVANVVEEFFGAVIVAGPSPTAGGDASGFKILFVVIERAKVLVDMFEDAIGRFAVAPKDGEVEFVVLQSADGEGEIDLKGADTGKDLIGDGGIGGIGCAHFFELGEDGVTFVDVAGVELEVLFVGFIGNLAGFSLHFSEEGFLLVGVGVGHRGIIPQRRGGVKPEKGFSCGGCRGRLAKLEA